MPKEYAEIPCKVCGKIFKPTHHCVRTCSPECKRIHEKNYNRKKAKQYRDQTKSVFKKGHEKICLRSDDRTLESMTPNQLLNYGKIQAQKQLEAMKRQKRA